MNSKTSLSQVVITITTEPSHPASSDPGSHPTVTPRQRLTTENTDEEEDLRESGEQSHEETTGYKPYKLYS